MSRKDTLLKAIIELFAEKGYNGTSTTEIAEKAGVAQGTLFYHFKNKEGMLLFILDDILGKYLADMEEIAQAPLGGLEAIKALIRNSTLFRQTHSQELLVLMRDFPADLIHTDSMQMGVIVQFFTRLHGAFRNCLERGQQDGSIRKLDAEKYAHILLGMLSGLDRHILLSPLLAPELTEEIIEFCHRALTPGEKRASL